MDTGVSFPGIARLDGRGCGTSRCLPLGVSGPLESEDTEFRSEVSLTGGRIGRSFFLRVEMRIWDRRGYTLKSWVLLIPVSAAALISVSRTMDYRHHAT
jgi:hypothetical protein